MVDLDVCCWCHITVYLFLIKFTTSIREIIRRSDNCVDVVAFMDSLVGSFVSIDDGMAGDPENFNLEVVLMEIMYIILNIDANIWRLSYNFNTDITLYLSLLNVKQNMNENTKQWNLWKIKLKKKKGIQQAKLRMTKTVSWTDCQSNSFSNSTSLTRIGFKRFILWFYCTQPSEWNAYYRLYNFKYRYKCNYTYSVFMFY